MIQAEMEKALYIVILFLNVMFSHSAPTLTSTQSSTPPSTSTPTSPQSLSTTSTTPMVTTTENTQEIIGESVASSTQGIHPDDIEFLCNNNRTGLFAHPTQCALYYNCSHVYQAVPTFLEQYLQECTYPMMFSNETGKCENYKLVKCGDRLEPKWECQYRKHWCVGPACGQPCESKYPSCIGKKNGKTPVETNVWLPYYQECQDERTLKITLCPYKFIFNPINRKCEPEGRTSAPKNYKADICSALVDGLYADIYGRCHKYFECKDRVFVSWEECHAGEVFDAESKTCLTPTEVCGPCGQKKVNW
ncbi:hypothetical protein FSP39_000733 [Pinctada imbricata]|uniref:Chitin-binding type-2 domain-containing protein n=1 Tax=Pinctada imbricata TaxID=66713 RepID=A0AA89BY72_PINIB|nr:hypothetical protein FSP39_000733 [Pinctada imbricata]